MSTREVFTIGRLIFAVYFLVWIVLLLRTLNSLSYGELFEIFMNATVISMFIGLGLNVNAFTIRNHDGRYRTLLDRFVYIRQHLGNVMAFFIIPFCVSSASSLVLVNEDGNVLVAVFGTDSYLRIIVLGFVVFLLIPSVYVVVRYGFRVGRD